MRSLCTLQKKIVSPRPVSDDIFQILCGIVYFLKFGQWQQMFQNIDFCIEIIICDLATWDHSPGDNARQVQSSVLKNFFLQFNAFWRMMDDRDVVNVGQSCELLWCLQQQNDDAYAFAYDALGGFDLNLNQTSLGQANGPPLSPEQAEIPFKEYLLSMKIFFKSGNPLFLS